MYCMNYDLYLKADGRLKFNLTKDRPGEYFSTHFADIFYSTDDDDKGTKIGFIQLLYYSQASAIANGISMSGVKYIAFQLGFKALKGFNMFKDFDNVFIFNVDQAVPDPVMVKKTGK